MSVVITVKMSTSLESLYGFSSRLSFLLPPTRANKSVQSCPFFALIFGYAALYVKHRHAEMYLRPNSDSCRARNDMKPFLEEKLARFHCIPLRDTHMHTHARARTERERIPSDVIYMFDRALQKYISLSFSNAHFTNIMLSLFFY